MRRILLSMVVIVLLALSHQSCAQEQARVAIPVIVQIPHAVVLDVDQLDLVFGAADFHDPELARITDEGVFVTKKQAIKVRAVGNVYSLV